MKLTRDYFKHKDDGPRIWGLIQLHTAECVAEAVAEAVSHEFKSRYLVGERVQFRDLGTWKHGVVGVVEIDCEIKGTFDSHEVRRPPKMRTRTDEELRMAICTKLAIDYRELELLSRPTLEAMARDLGIAMEVEDHEKI